ncbi:unnamed protein product (macronuclear) [Paramecium tetraurelia]|uniref:Receptor expression-enhancing protein n=1 Tax=Paramecium tetraurelia TaxID=5888 RepID=A0E3X0_PARTE|nr:uncharacterized protein GSPATT00023160001 [Paramecium tetraurelia]CAK89987.1 unnamed protein product [Paramecium tetraurelia]|eukprot:XP_001457384.1 hypothetical protein (macronuclear) [Paramecium tetraurelia strain d4-2]
MSACIYFCLLQLIASIIYPLRQTYQAYKLQEKLQIWVVYWILMSSIYLLEEISFGILFMIPGYSMFKTFYAIWLYHEKTQGALVVGTLLKPVFNKVKGIMAPFQEKLDILEKVK